MRSISALIDGPRSVNSNKKEKERMGDTLVEDSNPVVNGKKSNGDAESQLQALEEKARKAQEAFEKEEKLRKELEEQNTKLVSERNALQRQLDGEKGSLSEYMEKSLKLAAQKADIESQLQVSFHSSIIILYIIYDGCFPIEGKTRMQFT